MSDKTKNAEQTEEEEQVFRLAFGKHKGRTLEQVYSSGVQYLGWLAEQDYLNDETRVEIKNFLKSKKSYKK